MTNNKININRRQFNKLVATAGAATLIPSCALMTNSSDNATFTSNWHQQGDRAWIGAEYWSNPMQDWQIKDGKLLCNKAAEDRDVQLLTHQLGDRSGDFQLSVELGTQQGTFITNNGSAGFQLGIKGKVPDYRNALLYGRGLGAGISSDGFIFIGDNKQPINLPNDAVILHLTGKPSGAGYQLTLIATDSSSEKTLGQVSLDGVDGNSLTGNIALATNFVSLRTGQKNVGIKKWGWRDADPENTKQAGRFWFNNWQLSGAKISVSPDQHFGPILFSQYSMSRGAVRLSAQMPPIGKTDNQTVDIEIRPASARNGAWQKLATESIDPHAFCATFEFTDWDATQDFQYRLVYKLNASQKDDYYWHGKIQKDPVDKPDLYVADLSCNTHEAFPNFQIAHQLKQLNPDMIMFTGDQFYEHSGGYGVQFRPIEKAFLDVMRKWMLHGWSWRYLTNHIPSIALPDDHDVFHGNIWGEGGRLGEFKSLRDPTDFGYKMTLSWVNAIHKQQTGHNPKPYDSKPSVDGITNFYTELVYGRVSFAVLADRMYKSSPERVRAGVPGRVDHIKDENYDTLSLDVPGLELLGKNQEEFIEQWTQNWQDVDMKAVVSATPFIGMATTHGGKRLFADLDANGWPQTPRNNALKIMRKAFAIHITGDQHLPAFAQYGVDEHGDSSFVFASPALNTGYPRKFEPKVKGLNPPNNLLNTGDFLDPFTNKFTVLAVGIPPSKERKEVLNKMTDKLSGIGFLHFDKRTQKIRNDCWLHMENPRQAGSQLPGWPITVDMMDNFNPSKKYLLPLIKVNGIADPVFQVVDESNGEVVFTVRKMKTKSFQPFALKAGTYTVHVGDGTTVTKTFKGLSASLTNAQELMV